MVGSPCKYLCGTTGIRTESRTGVVPNAAYTRACIPSVATQLPIKLLNNDTIKWPRVRCGDQLEVSKEHPDSLVALVSQLFDVESLPLQTTAAENNLQTPLAYLPLQTPQNSSEPQKHWPYPHQEVSQLPGFLPTVVCCWVNQCLTAQRLTRGPGKIQPQSTNPVKLS